MGVGGEIHREPNPHSCCGAECYEGAAGQGRGDQGFGIDAEPPGNELEYDPCAEDDAVGVGVFHVLCNGV